MNTRTIAGLAAAIMATSGTAAIIAQAGTAPAAAGNRIVPMAAHRAVASSLQAARGRCNSDSPNWNGSSCRLLRGATASEHEGATAAASTITSAVQATSQRTAVAPPQAPSVAAPPVAAPGSSEAAPGGWVTRHVLDEDAPVIVTPINAALVTLDGKPREGDPRYYDLSINAGGTGLTTVSVYSAGAMTSTLHEDLLHVDSQTARVGVHMSYRYNTLQPVCLVQVLSTCAAHLPVDPSNPGWIASHANTSTLSITVNATVNGNLVSQSVDIPLAGQAGAILP